MVRDPQPVSRTASSEPLEGLIIGGGISGLALAHWLRLAEHPSGWELWEATDRLGGTIGTDHDSGYSVDWGPNGFLDREPLTLRLVNEIGLSDLLEPADESAGNRFIVKRGRLHPVPLSPLSVLTTGLLGIQDKLRIFMEPFIPARRDGGDESVFSFAARRIGRGAAASFIDPMVSGIFGGLARELSLPACFPIMREMEEQHGGLVRAMIARSSRRKRTAGKSGPAGPGGRLTSFSGGLDTLITRLGELLKPVIRLNHPVSKIARRGELWESDGPDGRGVLSRRVICACPTFAAAGMFAETDPELAEAFAAIPYAPIVVVASGHRRRDVVHPLDGFGFLIPRSEGLRTLGSIWTSSIFAARAPEGHVQFRSMLGGAGDPQAIRLSDDELWHILRAEIGPLVGLQGDPAFLRIYRWTQGIPQYTLGHIDRRNRLEGLCRLREGLDLVGNAFYGVSLNDCVKMARRVAQRIQSADKSS